MGKRNSIYQDRLFNITLIRDLPFVRIAGLIFYITYTYFKSYGILFFYNVTTITTLSVLN